MSGNEKTLGRVLVDELNRLTGSGLWASDPDESHYESAAQAVARVVESRLREEFRESLAHNLRCHEQEIADLRAVISSKNIELRSAAMYYRECERGHRQDASKCDLAGRFTDSGRHVSLADGYAALAVMAEAALALTVEAAVTVEKTEETPPPPATED